MPRDTSRPKAVRSKVPANSKHSPQQVEWLTARFSTFLDHQAKKTTRLFFPPLYKDYFAAWPTTPTPKDINEAGGNTAVAAATVRGAEELKIYRWMHNRTRSKHGVMGQGSNAKLNLTTGPPKKKAALQAYVKYYWESKIKQAVINEWAPTPQTDLFGEIENGEDQVAWEAMTPMEKNIPLWFRMKVGQKLYEAESEEVKAEVDRRREEEQQGAIFVESPTTFRTDEERLEVMKRLNKNFPSLGTSLQNLCRNILRDFGFHTTIIVGGPIVREDGRISTFTFESPGTVHKELTFSEFSDGFYETEFEVKFVEYLQSCFPKEDRKLYTLQPVPDVAVEPLLPSAAPPIIVPQATTPIPTPQASSGPGPGSIGPIRTTRGSRVRPRLLSKPVDRTSPASVVSPTSAPQAITVPSNPPEAGAEPSELSVPTTTTVALDVTPLPATEVLGDGASDSVSYTSTLPDVFDVGMDDSAPLATGPWMIIDHFTGNVIMDDNQSTPPPTIPAILTVPFGPSLAGVEVAVAPRLGTTYLIETPPVMLSEDEDVRPQWLMTAVNTFLRFVPCVGGLGKVIDLYLTQEERLGYPKLSARLALTSCNRPTEIASFMKWGRKYSRGDDVDAEKFGAAVVRWWLTIQPITRKDWPPAYNVLSDDFSFDYFNHGGPNGAFLMILCLGWWANALAPGMDFTDFNLIVGDVHWVLERIANRV